MGWISETTRRVVNQPIGVLGRNRPWYFLNAIDLARAPQRLEDAVRGKVVLVTGASSGIGAHTGRRVARAGATVLLVARGRDKLDDLKAAITAEGGTAHVHPCDLSDLEAIDGLAADVIAQHGGVDVLVNNAGRSIRRSVALSYDRFHDFERTMQLNYFGAVRLVLALLPSMRERQDGHIVNISSAGVQARAPRFAGYVASKAALDAFSDCVAAEVHHDGVRFTTVFMPLVRTPMIAPTTIYQQMPAMTPDEAATMVCDAIVYRPRRLGTPAGNAAGFVNTVTPRTADAIRNVAYRLFPESKAATGEADKGEPEGVGVAGQVLARVARGVHW